MGIPRLAAGGEVGSVTDIAQRHMDLAARKLELDALVDLSRYKYLAEVKSFTFARRMPSMFHPGWIPEQEEELMRFGDGKGVCVVRKYPDPLRCARRS